MPSEFSSNIRQISRELKETNAKTAAGVRRAIRKSIAIAATATNEAIVAAAEAEGLHKAAAATNVKVSFAVRNGGAVIRTDQNKARYARALEKGSKGAGGAYDRHPVFARGGLRPGQSGPLRDPTHFRNDGGYTVTYVNQPTRPFFFDTALAMEPFSEGAMNAALDLALMEAGWHGVTRRSAARAATARRASVQKATRVRAAARKSAKEAAARQREYHRVFGTKEQKAAVRAYEAEQAAKRAARQKKHA